MVSLLIDPVAGHAAVSSLYLLSVVVAGLRFSRGPVLFVAASSALAWYTVFIPPRFQFHIGTIEDAIIFVSFFAVAMAMGHLTSKLRLTEIAERRREQRTAREPHSNPRMWLSFSHEWNIVGCGTGTALVKYAIGYDLSSALSV